MNYTTLLRQIDASAQAEDVRFSNASVYLQEQIFELPKGELLPLIREIGALPESIPHDSTAEKLYAKVADMLLARCFQLLGLRANVNRGRANVADVTGESELYTYSFVADAKVFRLSRTAKNQKDFKVRSMADWRGEHDFAILVCPYYQYPKNRSQIYGQALNENVCLLSWEHLGFLLEHDVTETDARNLAWVWNLSADLSQRVIHAERDDAANFMVTGNAMLDAHLILPEGTVQRYVEVQKNGLLQRAEAEIAYWQQVKQEVAAYSRQQAITELLRTLKVDEKIEQISRFIASLAN